MSNYKLSDEEKQTIEDRAKYDQILRFLKRKEDFRFKVGDVLIKQTKSSWKDDGAWKNETMSQVSSANKKYVYVHENDLGVGYIKPVLKTGELGSNIMCMTQFHPDEVRFAVDPEYIEHIMLADEGETFDAKADYQRKKVFRENAYKANKKILLNLSDTNKVHLFFNTAKVGDRFWWGYTMDTMVKDQYEITDIQEKTNLDRWEKERWEELKKDIHRGNPKYLTISAKRVADGQVMPFEMSGCYKFFTDKAPFPLEENK